MQLANIKDVNFIVLYGEPNAGKTTTLNELIISLSDDRKNVGKIEVVSGCRFCNKSVLSNNEVLKKHLNCKNKYQRKKNKEYDHIYSFEYREKSVLVITEGDNMFKLLYTLVYNFLLHNKIDIVVCAAREKFLKVFVEHLSTKLGVNNNNIDIDKELQKGKNKNDDTDMAKKILKKIDNLIKKSGN